MTTVQGLMNSIHRPAKRYRIKVVPKSDPNADGSWIDAGTRQFPARLSFSRMADRLADVCPAEHFIVQIESDE